MTHGHMDNGAKLAKTNLSLLSQLGVFSFGALFAF